MKIKHEKGCIGRNKKMRRLYAGDLLLSSLEVSASSGGKIVCRVNKICPVCGRSTFKRPEKKVKPITGGSLKWTVTIK